MREIRAYDRSSGQSQPLGHWQFRGSGGVGESRMHGGLGGLGAGGGEASPYQSDISMSGQQASPFSQSAGRGGGDPWLNGGNVGVSPQQGQGHSRGLFPEDFLNTHLPSTASRQQQQLWSPRGPSAGRSATGPLVSGPSGRDSSPMWTGAGSSPFGGDSSSFGTASTVLSPDQARLYGELSLSPSMSVEDEAEGRSGDVNFDDE